MSNTLDINSASALMNVHPKTVLDLINKGALPAGKVGRAYVLLTRDVMNYIEAIIVRQTADRMGLPHPGRQIRSSKVGVSAQHL